MTISKIPSFGTKLYAVPNAHIDPVWIWDWREGMREVVATFRAAADRLDENEDLYFAASSACYYAWVELVDPELFARIRKHVAAERWELVGGEWVEPDCTMPSGESVCRHLLYAQRYFWNAFGRTATVAYNIDSFGHAGTLPQLFKKAGLDSYVMMRPQEHERTIAGPLFRWEGVDGTVIDTFRIEPSYTTGLLARDDVDSTVNDERRLIAERASLLCDLAEQRGIPVMFFVGVGDHGGGPTRTAIKQLREIEALAGGGLTFASPSQYFRAVDAMGVRTSLPKVSGDLHMHAVGCYSVVSWVKEANVIAERALGTAEVMASLCSLMTGIDLHAGPRMREAWLRVLFNQFHDSLGGTCTEETFRDLRQFYGYARTIADEVTATATHLIAARTDTFVEGADAGDRLQSANPFSAHFPVPVVVFNPLSWPVRAPLVFPHPASEVTAADGTPIAVQNVISREGTRYAAKATVVAELPAVGYRVFWLHEPAPALGALDVQGQTGEAGGATERRIETEHFIIAADILSGAITHLRSKRSRREWLAAGGLRPVVLDDTSDTWSHGVVGYDGGEQACTLQELRVVESGPVRSKLRLRYRFEESYIYLDVIAYETLEYVDVVLHADWRQRHQLLKLVLPIAISSHRHRVGLPYGATEREANGREEVAVRWLDVFEDTSGAGMICCADTGYGYDVIGSRVRFTALRSPRYADHGGSWTGEDVIDWPATDQGLRTMSYRLCPHDEPAVNGEGQRRAAEHITVLPQVTETWHRGALGAAGSAVTIEPGNVVVSVLKRGEDDSGWVVRLNETAGKATRARVVLDPLGRSFEADLHGYELVTLLIPDDAAAPVREIAITELELRPDSGPR